MPVNEQEALKRLSGDFSEQWNNRQTNYDETLKEVAEFVYPNAKRFIGGDKNHDRAALKKVLYNEGKKSLDTLASGMLSGTCSPSRDWFKLGVSKFQNTDSGFILALQKLERAAYLELARSNFYRAMHQVYKFEGAFGTACALIDDIEDEKKDAALNLILMPFGSYALRVDYLNRVDGLYRKFNMTAKDIVKTFGEKDLPEKVQIAITDKKMNAMFVVLHIIESTPNDMFVEGKQEIKKAYSSYYFLEGEKDKFLRIAGFDSFPAIAPRWEVIGDDPYGESPATLSLGDFREAQKLKVMMLEGTERMVNPPILLPSTMKDQTYKLVPRGVLFFEPSMVAGSTQAQAQNAMNIQVDYNGVMAEYQDCINRIKGAFYTDLFLMLDGFDKTNMTATEVAERKSEKMLMLGSVLERQTDEALRPVITNVVERILTKLQARYPEVVAAFEPYADEEYDIEFVSILAQAQKASGSANLERGTQYLMGLAGVNEDVALLIQPEKMARQYVDMNSMSADVLKSPEEFKKAKDELMQQRQQAAQMAQLQQTAQATGNAAQAVNAVSEMGQNPNIAPMV